MTHWRTQSYLDIPSDKLLVPLLTFLNLFYLPGVGSEDFIPRNLVLARLAIVQMFVIVLSSPLSIMIDVFSKARDIGDYVSVQASSSSRSGGLPA
nr:hypothetical protein CFP56_13274 [Quercus suber]